MKTPPAFRPRGLYKGECSSDKGTNRTTSVVTRTRPAHCRAISISAAAGLYDTGPFLSLHSRDKAEPPQLIGTWRRWNWLQPDTSLIGKEQRPSPNHTVSWEFLKRPTLNTPYKFTKLTTSWVWISFLTLKNFHSSTETPPYKTSKKGRKRNNPNKQPHGTSLCCWEVLRSIFCSCAHAKHEEWILLHAVCFSMFLFLFSKQQIFSDLSYAGKMSGIFNRICECPGTTDFWVSACSSLSTKWIPHDRE